MKAIRKYGCQANVSSALKIVNRFILCSGTFYQSNRSSLCQGVKPPGFPVTHDNKCCGSAYIDHIKIAQFLCEDAWVKTPVSANLHASGGTTMTRAIPVTGFGRQGMGVGRFVESQSSPR